MLTIQHPSHQQNVTLDQLWLRDHCRCAECYNIQTNQRKYSLLDIPKDIRIHFVNYANNGSILCVQWNDNHKSEYDVDLLFRCMHENRAIDTRIPDKRFIWNLNDIMQNQCNLRFQFTKIVATDDYVPNLVETLIRFGIVVVDGVPATVTMTEMLVRSLFPIMKTLFGEMYTFSDEPIHADTAYTKEYLGPHTDNTYFCDAAGLQALHCLQHSNGEGGENFFIDGYYTALQLQNLHPDAYNVLTKVEVPAEYIEKGQHHKHSAPLIRIDPVTKRILQLRLNVYDRAVFDTLPQNQMKKFYEAFRLYLEIIQNPVNQWCFKLHPGTVVIFDNWRIYHGRKAYTGQRIMTGCYVQRTDFLSKARILGIIE